MGTDGTVARMSAFVYTFLFGMGATGLWLLIDYMEWSVEQWDEPPNEKRIFITGTVLSSLAALIVSILL